uniref:Rho guanine nucleotide exchange factor 16 n=2 Tax=Latimeria chalumnae TaxID=7897 RepID=H3BID8_LATCH
EVPQRHSDGTLEDKSPLLLERKYVSKLHIKTTGAARGQQAPSACTQDDSDKSPECTPSPVDCQKVILSTDSMAALKRGTQQLIPKGLAAPNKTKMRHSTILGDTSTRRTSSQDPKRESAPNLSFDEWDYAEEAGGTLTRNRRNQSYRAAMKGLVDSQNGESAKPVSSLKPVTEESAAQRSRSPARNKKAIGRRKNQKQGGSFKDEPKLYQEIRERGLHSNNQEQCDDDEFNQGGSSQPGETIVIKNFRPTQLTWSQLPQVQEMGILENISPEERKRQEAIFELITSEYSYQHSLDVLVRLFMSSEDLRKTLTSTEHHHLFSNISDIQEASKRFFDDLERVHKMNPVIGDVGDLVEHHASNQFNPYVSYCSNEVYQQRTLQKLLLSNAAFKDELKQIEMKSECGGLPMISFLILPMQRVTRLPLLMDTICQKTHSFLEKESAARGLKAISKLVKKCNEGARKMERTEQMYTIQTQLEFGKIKKAFPLVSSSRWLLRRGELSSEETGLFRIGFGKQHYLFLFNDVLIITKKKNEESYMVLDYAKLDDIEVETVENGEPQLSPPGKGVGGGTTRAGSSNQFKIIMCKNSEGKREQITLATESLSDKARWITALQYNKQKDQDTGNKEDLLQVEIIKAYLAKQPDELALQQADVVTVLQQVDDWYHGERLRDGEKGWFPQACSQVITNRNAVEWNVRRMERLRIETDV